MTRLQELREARSAALRARIDPDEVERAEQEIWAYRLRTEGPGRPRLFDPEEAARLRRKGWSYERIGRELGVSDTSVKRALNPQKPRSGTCRCRSCRAVAA